MITYPRKCNDCEYMSNNPAMWHYHKQTHESIPVGILCNQGCGQQAEHKNTNGNYTCSKPVQHCPMYKTKHAEQVTKQWAKPKSIKRKKELSKRSLAYTPEQRAQQATKQSQTKRRKRLATENTWERRKYNRSVIYHSNKNYQKHKNKINPMNLIVGRKEHHLDHQVSKFVGWMLNIPIDYISNPKNLKILYYKDNCGKRNRCTLHPLALLRLCEAPADLVTCVKANIHSIDHLII